MPQIVPAILENTKEGFLDKISRVVKLPGLQRIQVDFADGIFVPNNILPVSEIDTLNPAFGWEAHLMLKAPMDFLDYQICGFKTIVIHYEAYADAGELKKALAAIHALGLKVAVAINPPTGVEVLRQLDGLADQFLIMSVNPGFQGQAFIPQTLDRIKALRQTLPRAIIEVDGGVNMANVKDLAAAGCDLICVGSALTKAENMPEAWEKLRQEVN